MLILLLTLNTVNYPDLQKSELPDSTIAALATIYAAQRLMQCPQACEFGLFHPYYEYLIYAAAVSPQTFLQDIDSGISVSVHRQTTIV